MLPDSARANAAFEMYYKAQGIVPEEQWEVFLRTLRKPLPAVVRINTSKPGWESLREEFRASKLWVCVAPACA
jgi:hypothetical protein